MTDHPYRDGKPLPNRKITVTIELTKTELARALGAPDAALSVVLRGIGGPADDGLITGICISWTEPQKG